MRALIVACVLFAAPAQAASDARGRLLFLQCQACHSLAKGHPYKLGPNLRGIMGAPAASRPDFGYSAALQKSGIVWTAAALDRWLMRPSAMVPGNKMVFAGLARAEDRAALIAYLTDASR